MQRKNLIVPIVGDFAGPKALRACLVQASWVLWRTQPHDPLNRWAHAVAERRGKQVAICALARKLAGVLWAMWRDERVYNNKARTM